MRLGTAYRIRDTRTASGGNCATARTRATRPRVPLKSKGSAQGSSHGSSCAENDQLPNRKGRAIGPAPRPYDSPNGSNARRRAPATWLCVAEVAFTADQFARAANECAVPLDEPALEVLHRHGILIPAFALKYGPRRFELPIPNSGQRRSRWRWIGSQRTGRACVSGLMEGPFSTPSSCPLSPTGHFAALTAPRCA